MQLRILLLTVVAVSAMPLRAQADASDMCLVPFRAATAMAGTPVAIAREIPHNYHMLLKEYCEDNNSWKIGGMYCSIPVAVVAGIFKGVIGGTRNAFKYKPFTKDAFSFGSMESQ